MEVRDLYDSIANEYDIYDDTNQLVAEDLFTYGIIRSRAKLWSILDLGCGTGRAIRFLKPNPISYLGIDISPHMLEKATEKFPRHRFINCNFMGYELQEKPSCVISLFGSPCYTPILDLMIFLKTIKSKIYLGMYGVGRNTNTFAAVAEKDVLRPWSAGRRELEIIHRYFQKVKIWKMDLYAPWKQKIPVPIYANLLKLESLLPISSDHYAWVLAEIDNE